MSAITVEDLKKNYAKGVRDFGAMELVDASLRNEDLYGINLSRSCLIRAQMSGAQLCTAKLIMANLRNADLSDANLYGADLSDAVLSGAALSGAQMKNVCLEGAWMSGANLYGARNITRIENCARDGGSLIAVRWDSGIMFQRGCFWGTEDQMVEFLREREAAWPRRNPLPFKATLKYWQAMMDACKLAMPAE